MYKREISCFEYFFNEPFALKKMPYFAHLKIKQTKIIGFQALNEYISN